MTTSKRVLSIGCGFYGTKVIKRLAASDLFSDIVIGEIDAEKARKAAGLVAGSGKNISTVDVDATSMDSLLKAAENCDLIVNISGPFHLTGVPAIRAAMKLGINYVDINANKTALDTQMAIAEEVEKAGITALVCFGDIPGIANIVARHGADRFEEVDELHIGCGGGRYRFPLVGVDRLWRNVFDKPAIFKEGTFVEVPPCSDPEVIHPPVSAPFEVMAANLPLVATIPLAYPKIKLVTFKTGLGPKEIGNDIFRLMFTWGFNSDEPIDVKGQKISPKDFAIAFLASDVHSAAVGLMNRDVNDVSGTQYGGFQFRILGKKNGQAARLILGYYDSCFHMTEVTCAFAAEQLVKGLIPQKGIVIPEAVDPIPFLEMAKKEGVVLQETFEDVL